MALILQIETSTTSCSVALAQDGLLLAVKEQTERNIHASHITVFIEEVLKSAGYTAKDLDAVAVCMGPGSYTGLRIGVSTAKGLCYALDIPLVALSTLKVMAAGLVKQFEDKDVLLCPMIDARRMEVYTALFDKALEEIAAVEAKIIDGESFADILATRKVVFFGDGAEKCREMLGDHPNSIFVNDFNNSAAHATAMAYEKFKLAQFEDVAYFEPYYLKDFIAGKPKAQ
ncbi:tRNA (adenosine(37)-N6)-threonylcarbamoyltransferase complex dimerization subunit type 1 TsaB [Pedobacter sp. SYSU D00535]|uniref:tRNA (adenosine(37)-N6)-threonylcarbamoyltransferase complex dimerization subunit type 1 TsaB n=1 Tax=Pedobacter sp. SYSU D00535 TaxID=2810308 RepID=UPI001A960FF9|nr:tRNA (adenosine(37)-N6)-threonylcarbamoyltransferase complex dimerization subunit type 1 TsaB [Pedobacter sp. SYSU D00535]